VRGSINYGTKPFASTARWRINHLPIAAKPARFWELLSAAAGFRYNDCLHLQFEVMQPIGSADHVNGEESDTSWQALYNLENQ
jgi:hypothetical protein